jgi:hypothetical protein
MKPEGHGLTDQLRDPPSHASLWAMNLEWSYLERAQPQIQVFTVKNRESLGEILESRGLI